MLAAIADLIRFRRVYQGHAGAGQIVVYCLHSDCNGDGKSNIIGIGVVQSFAYLKAVAHIERNHRAGPAT